MRAHPSRTFPPERDRMSSPLPGYCRGHTKQCGRRQRWSYPLAAYSERKARCLDRPTGSYSSRRREHAFRFVPTHRQLRWACSKSATELLRRISREASWLYLPELDLGHRFASSSLIARKCSPEFRPVRCKEVDLLEFGRSLRIRLLARSRHHRMSDLRSALGG